MILVSTIFCNKVTAVSDIASADIYAPFLRPILIDIPNTVQFLAYNPVVYVSKATS